jgi:hypothetical protein
MAAFVAPPLEGSFPGLKPIDPTDDAAFPRPGDESTEVSVPGFTFDFRKVADRATLLFPFLTPGVALERFALTPKSEVRDRLHNPLAAAREDPHQGSRKPPLALDGVALQSLIDKSWSRRDRWSAFQHIVKLAETYSSDTGKLPDVLHAYLKQDGLQLYADTTIRDPRLWTQLGLAADHVPFVGFISRYASDHPSTEAATELLFLLDALAEASLDALVTLLNIDPGQDLQWTRGANRDAFSLIVNLRRHFKAHLERRGLASAEALRTYYDNVRLAILAGILRTTPHAYRASDARYLMGAIYWRQGRPADALASWRDMTIDPTDNYVTAYSEILTAVRDGAGGASQRLGARQINRVLDGEHGRWLSLSFDRLRQFGYRFDTF